MQSADPNSRKVASFPYNRISKKFDTSEYTPSMTDNKASLEDVLPFLRDIEAHLVKFEVFLYKHRCDAPSLFYYSFICVILYLGYYLSKKDDSWTHFIGYCLIGGGLLMCVMFTTGDISRKFQESRQRFIKEADFSLALIMDKYNPIFKEKGLRWAFDSPHLKYAELWTCSPNEQTPSGIPQEQNNEGISLIPSQKSLRKSDQFGYAKLE